MRTAGRASSSCLDFGESVISQGPSLGAGGAEAARCSFRRAPRPCASGFLDPVAGNTSCCPAIFMPSGIHSAPPLLGSTAKGRGRGQKAGRRARRGAAGGRAGAGHLRRRQCGSARVARAGRLAPCQDTGIAPSPPFKGPFGSRPSYYERLSGGTAPRRGRPTGGRGPHLGPPQGGPQARKSGHAVALHDTGRLLATLCGATSYERFPCRITWITPPKPPSNVLPASSMQAARLVFTRFIMLILLPRQGRFVKIVPSCERNALFKPTCGTRLRTSQLARPGRPASQYTLRTPSVHACTSPTAVTGTWVQPSCGVSPTFRHARAPLKLSLAHAAAQGIGPSAPLPARPHCGARRNARQGARGRRARILMTRPPRTPAGGAGR